MNASHGEFEPDQVALSLFTIYHQPELVDPYRIREFFVLKSGQVQAGPVRGAAASLNAIRRLLPPGVDARLDRNDSDAPEIVETWM